MSDRLDNKRKKAPEVKPEVPWVNSENLGVDENWEVDGLCRNGGYDPNLWFPSPDEDNSVVKLAQKVCYQCPVISECRTIALARGEKHGIWGGLLPHERRRMRKS